MIKYHAHSGVLDEAMLGALLELRQTMQPERTISMDHIAGCNQFAKRGMVLHYAKHNEKWVGYKLGYEEKFGVFFSWIGGVAAAYRGQGIASTLMQQQHQWCAEHHYSTLTTLSNNSYKTMMRLNLKHGFDITGIRTDGPRVQILFTKQLSSK